MSQPIFDKQISQTEIKTILQQNIMQRKSSSSLEMYLPMWAICEGDSNTLKIEMLSWANNSSLLKRWKHKSEILLLTTDGWISQNNMNGKIAITNPTKDDIKTHTENLIKKISGPDGLRIQVFPLKNQATKNPLYDHISIQGPVLPKIVNPHVPMHTQRRSEIWKAKATLGKNQTEVEKTCLQNIKMN